ncbi:thiamine pyrophosphate-binding protein [Candidatus Kaiserbacteria bacterium]|nr:thiamine pyrophosphate-binding protein [Candidatus Kaiserbacteria bacterium]
MNQTTNLKKLSDYVAEFLANVGIRHVFIISGGASIHLLHSLARRTDIQPICPHHEQAAAMSADGYARATGGLGCAIGTSGPGATNLITGIAGAWFDSVPVIFITGQVATYRMRGDTGVRQMGFQETDILSMVASITKYSAQIRKTEDVAFELEKAAHIAVTGRPGPVLLDIPDDLQRQMIEPDSLRHFAPAPAPTAVNARLDFDIDKVLELARDAERPVVVLGWGIRLANADHLARDVMLSLGFPVLTSWGAKDIIEEANPLLVGTFGTHGVRAGNFAIQNADLIIAVGARLSTHETGTPMKSWARGAKVVVVDIDAAELGKFEKFGKPLTMAIQADARVFLCRLKDRLSTWRRPALNEWRARIADWRARYPAVRLAPPTRNVDPYAFMTALANAMSHNENVFVDTGASVAWLMQAFPTKLGQRLFHDFNNTAMGWALPAAIGGCLALGARPVTCISGDGSLMMNLQELATLQRHNLPVRLFIINNQGYGMVQQTQEQWLGGEYVGTSYEGGLGFPNFVALAESFGLPTMSIETKDQVPEKLRAAYRASGPVVIDVKVPRTERVTPQARFGYPIEDADPLLPREEFFSNMLVQPEPKSREPLV